MERSGAGCLLEVDGGVSGHRSAHCFYVTLFFKKITLLMYLSTNFII